MNTYREDVPRAHARLDAQNMLVAIQAMADAIRKAKEIPSGALYANLAGRMDLPVYERIIRVLVGAGVVYETGENLLIWVGAGKDDK